MNIPSVLWVVIDQAGHANAYANRQQAELQAQLWDIEFPSLGPHQVVPYTPTFHAIATDNTNAKPNPAVAPETA